MYKSFLLAGTILGLAVNANPACAQTTASAPANASAPGQDAIPDIVVTAEHRQADVQKTAVAVTVRNGEDLLQQGRQSVQQILEDVPSVSIVSTVAGTVGDNPANAIAIRGVASSGTVNGDLAPTAASVAYYVDGVLNGVGGDYDLSGVQVLRGPMGTLYGRSATAGAVLVSTTDPEIGVWHGNIAVEAGDYGLNHESIALNIPIDDQTALRVSANRYQRDGYYANLGGAILTNEARAKLLWKPSSSFTALFGFAVTGNDLNSGQYQGHINGLGTDNVSYADTPIPIGSGHERTLQYWARFDWNLGPVTLTYIPALRDYSSSSTAYSEAPPMVIENTQSVPKDIFHTEEFRITSNATGPLKWQAGLFYYYNHLIVSGQGRINDFTGDPDLSLVLFSVQPEQRTTTNFGAFTEATWSFTPRTRLTAGIRYDYTKVETSQVNCNGPVAGDAQPSNCVTLTGDEGTRSWNNVTYKARLEQDLSPHNLLYASVSSAFIPGNVAVTTGQNLQLTIAPYDPE